MLIPSICVMSHYCLHYFTINRDSQQRWQLLKQAWDNRILTVNLLQAQDNTRPLRVHSLVNHLVRLDMDKALVVSLPAAHSYWLLLASRGAGGRGGALTGTTMNDCD